MVSDRGPNSPLTPEIPYHYQGFGDAEVIPRYTREEMGRVWSDANRYQKWLDVELAAADSLAEAGQVPQAAAAALRARAKVDVARINELEAKVKHDVIAFTMAVGESIGDPPTARWLHYGMTSNDVVDTAQALLVRDASAKPPAAWPTEKSPAPSAMRHISARKPNNRFASALAFRSPRLPRR